MDNNSASTEFKQLIAKGKDQGYLTIDEINDLIPPDIISGDQLSVFIQTFIDMGINVCETPPEADDILLMAIHRLTQRMLRLLQTSWTVQLISAELQILFVCICAKWVTFLF